MPAYQPSGVPPGDDGSCHSRGEVRVVRTGLTGQHQSGRTTILDLSLVTGFSLRVPQLDSRITTVLSGLAAIVPNPATDFARLPDAVEAWRRAAEAALPEILRLLESPPATLAPAERVLSLRFDPVCGMVISPTRARARIEHRGTTYYFCSTNCRARFERGPEDYLSRPVLHFG